MKRALVLLSLAAGTLAGCAVAPRPAADGPLSATLYPGSRAPRVSLSAPAYVAIFDVRPETGTARLVYPDPGAEQVPLRRGKQTLAGATAAYHAWFASTVTGGSSGVLYMVASREPLRLEAFAVTRDARQAVGADVPWDSEVGEIAGALARAVVANPADGAWTESVMWPRSRDNRAATRSASAADTEFQLPPSASCGNGQTVSRTGDRSAITNCPAQP